MRKVSGGLVVGVPCGTDRERETCATVARVLAPSMKRLSRFQQVRVLTYLSDIGFASVLVQRAQEGRGEKDGEPDAKFIWQLRKELRGLLDAYGTLLEEADARPKGNVCSLAERLCLPMEAARLSALEGSGDE